MGIHADRCYTFISMQLFHMDCATGDCKADHRELPMDNAWM